MKRLAYILLFLLPTAMAQNYQGMTEADMQKMMQRMQKAQACMENVDQAELDGLEQRAKKMETEIKALCAGGKRDKAQESAMAFGKEMSSAPAMQQVRKCSKMMGNMMPKMPFSGENEDYSKHHVCDDF